MTGSLSLSHKIMLVSLFKASATQVLELYKELLNNSIATISLAAATIIAVVKSPAAY